jgi:hypothetical protein
MPAAAPIDAWQCEWRVEPRQGRHQDKNHRNDDLKGTQRTVMVTSACTGRTSPGH